MLAYVFWHWQQAGIDRDVYEDHQRDFQQTLTANKPNGFQHSAVFRISGATWLDNTGDAYEDWYVVEDSAALDPLNEGAVSGACEVPHNRVAREAADGTAGLYRLRMGTANLAHARFAVWLSKPANVLYKDFYAAMEPLTSQPGVALWGRQMTLGPATEFCLQSPSPIQLPPGYFGLTISLETIWPQMNAD